MSGAAAEFEWNEVGAQEAENFTPVISFKEMGQSVVGKYIGTQEVKGGKFGDENHFIFQSKDGKFAINPNPDLRKRYSVLKVNDIVRTTWVAEKDVGQPSLMKVFKVEVAKKKTTAAPGTAATAPAAPAQSAPKASASGDDSIPF